jgi:hypothetical protein
MIPLASPQTSKPHGASNAIPPFCFRIYIPNRVTLRSYRQMLQSSVWVLCPGGFVHPETFRLYEALEAGAIPVLQQHQFWTYLFAQEPPPFPLISGPSDICQLLEMSDESAESLRLATLAWYRRFKTAQARSIRQVVENAAFL